MSETMSMIAELDWPGKILEAGGDPAANGWTPFVTGGRGGPLSSSARRFADFTRIPAGGRIEDCYAYLWYRMHGRVLDLGDEYRVVWAGIYSATDADGLAVIASAIAVEPAAPTIEDAWPEIEAAWKEASGE